MVMGSQTMEMVAFVDLVNLHSLNYFRDLLCPPIDAIFANRNRFVAQLKDLDLKLMQKCGRQLMLAAHCLATGSQNCVEQANWRLQQQLPPNLNRDDEIAHSLIAPCESRDGNVIRMGQLAEAAVAYATNRTDCRAYLAAATEDDVSKRGHFGRFASDSRSNSIDCLHCSNLTMNWNSWNFSLFLCLVAVIERQSRFYLWILRRFLRRAHVERVVQDAMPNLILFCMSNRRSYWVLKDRRKKHS